MKRFKRYYLMLRLFLMSPFKRAKYLKRKKYFGSCGDGCYFQIVNFNTEPQLIEFGNNVFVASGVKFWTHDIIAMMTNQMHNKKNNVYSGRIIIGNNVFIGGGRASCMI